MTKPTQPDISEGWAPSSTEPGLYESPFDDYPGSVRFPYPLLYAPHFQEYWQIAIAPMQNLSDDYKGIEWNFHDLPWKGAVHLITVHGEWDIKGISEADFKAGKIPLKVQQWVAGCAKHYLLPELSPKARLVVFTLT